MRLSTSRRISKALAGVMAAGTMLLPQMAVTATTLLVNNEAFSYVQEGDGSTNLEIRFGQTLQEKITYDRTNQRFLFSRGIFVGGNIRGTGSLAISGNMSGASLRVSGPADVQGALAASGSVRTDGDLTINDDAGAADAILTFGNATANQTIKYLNTAQKFQFSKSLSVVGSISGSSLTVDGATNVRGALSASGAIRTEGNLSGASLTVDGAFNWRGISYTAPTSQSANTFLKTDGAGGLSWAASAVGNGSGGIMSLHPEYPNAVYFSSGSTTVGQLTYSYDSTNKQNYYRWTSSRGALHDYWIAIRVRLPDNFSSWDVIKPIEFRYRTGDSSNAVNYLNVKLLDTSNNFVALTGGTTLANTSWTTANITGPQAAGTFAAKGYITVLLKLATTSAGSADAGFLNLNFETTNP